MELNDVARRIVGQHWDLIAIVMLIGVMSAAIAHLGDATTYTASARLVLGTQDPKTQAESASIADTAKAIATSPALVKRALRSAGPATAGRDPVEVAANDISVASVGASGVLQLRVKDRDAAVAARLANAVARQVLEARRQVTEGEMTRVLASVSPRIEALASAIARLDARPSLTPEQQGRRSSLVQQRTALESERFSALAAVAQQPKPAIISAATPPASADTSNTALDLLLGAVLGLTLGVAIAAAVETFRPTLVGGTSLARELNVPLLGTLPPAGDEDIDDATHSVGGRLRLATKSAGVKNVSLMAVRPPELDLPALVQRFGTNGNSVVRPGAVRPFDPGSTVGNGSSTGLVVVSPDSLKKAELDDVKELLRVTPGPLLGILTYRRPGGR